ncbi:MAG TPA: DUF2569 family protein [Micropepsaceae bacterium]|nr:DUF2569 family protein [Micropepsaceae bacterium]
MSTQATSRQDEHRTGLHGVRGWLLLLCIYLVIVMPLIAVLGAIGALQRAATAPALRGVLIGEVVLELALAGLAAFAGWALYRMRPKAVRIAKIYFIIMFVLAVFGLVMVLVTAPVLTESQDNAALFKTLRAPATVAAIRQAILSAVWLIYLMRSKRVRATYPKT